MRKYGVGSGAVGRQRDYDSASSEERIAAFRTSKTCVVFQSTAANAGTVSALLTPEDHIISDG